MLDQEEKIELKSNGMNSKKGVIIGLSVGGSTILYAGLTALVIRAYKKRATRRQENNIRGSISL